MARVLQTFREFALPHAFDTAAHSSWYIASMERLLEAVQELSHARDIDTIAEIVREAARNLTGADGATFVLRDGDQCFYADENAIAPLWKGMKFPMGMCISGWVMHNGRSVAIKDIYADSRIPASAYRPTFVKSLAMVPIRRKSPIGAIGNYWATPHECNEEEIAILQALADTTSVALENVDLYSQLQAKVAELEKSNYELSCFAWAASHDLQEPLRTIAVQVELLGQRCHDSLDERALGYISTAAKSAGRLQRLIGDLLLHARSGRTESFHKVSLSEMMQNAIKDLKIGIDECGARIIFTDLPEVLGNQHLLECLLRNLLSNAIKYRSSSETPLIQVSAHAQGNEWIVEFKDNGLGISPEYHQRIFGLLQRLHTYDEYPGSGIGLATCRKVVELHGGRIWVESAAGKGTTFCFTLPVSFS